MIVREHDERLGTVEAIVRDVLGTVIGRIGPPTLYGGAAGVSVIRWRDDQRTVLLDHSAEGLRLSVWRTAELEAEEEAGFERDARAEPASYFSGLPYLWQLHRGAGTPPRSFPSVGIAPDWCWLEESLKVLLGAWRKQLPVQLGHDVAGFNVIPRGNRENDLSALSVLFSETEDVMLLVDDRSVPGGTPHDEMEHRGWQDRIMGWWRRDFYDLGAGSAAAAARMAVDEIRLRRVRSPADLGVDEVRCEGGGRLALPGLAIGR
ncbi:hypothetical protein [Streptomyces sp. 769]|uniref:hypothetical protein n=1 Tax=Streptomyces sp. 769 TaxID=1262452 RepID=UPI0005822AC4|nr:hypothetical protein [Streptomyces sp. 769]AJC54986.1 hypothetical protein GZL_02395 [Streptomyces sp. 769]